MKKAIIASVLFGFCLAGLSADAPRNDVIVLTRAVAIANPEAFPDYLVFAYVTGPQLKGARSFNVYEISAGAEIEKYDPNNEVAVIAIKRSAVKSLGLDAIDFARLVDAEKIVPARIAQPLQTGTYQEPPPPIREEIVYAITALYNDNVYLQPAKKTLYYAGGKVVEKTYIEHPAPRRYTRMVKASSVKAGSQLADQEFFDRYSPARAFDGAPETGWSEGASGSGVGETITIVFAKPVTVDRISVMPGWFDARYYRKNNRVKSLIVQSDTFKAAATFGDTMTAQDIPLSNFGKPPFTFTTISFRITDVYRGTDWDDTPIAEVTFSLNGEPYLVDLSGLDLIDSCYGKDHY